jgi:hypothetical protein
MRLAHLGLAGIGMTTLIVVAHAQAPGDPQKGSALGSDFASSVTR